MQLQAALTSPSGTGFVDICGLPIFYFCFQISGIVNLSCEFNYMSYTSYLKFKYNMKHFALPPKQFGS